MKQYVLLCILVALCGLSYAQTVTFIDDKTEEPLAWVTLASESPSAFANTDQEGQVDISAFKGAQEIEIRLIGYTTITRSYQELATAVTISISSGLALDQVVVSASRWGQNKREIPARVTTISPKSVALQNPQTAADLLGTSGEVFIQKSQQGGGSPMIRGFSTNRLLITVDGVRMNNAIFRSGNLQNVISLDPFATESAEVLFGPASVIYGSDAIGGVMSFQTLDPNISFTDEVRVEGKAIARYASANQEQSGHFDIGLGWRKWAMTTSFTTNRYGDLRMGSHGPEEYLRPFYVQRQDSMDVIVANDDPLVQRPSGYDQINLMQKVRFRPNEHWDFRYGFHYSTTTDYARYDRHIRLRNGLPRSAEWHYGPQTWMMNHVSVDHHASVGLYDQMTLRLAHQFFEESRIDRDFNGSTRARRVEKVNAYSANLDFSKVIADHHFYYGLEAVLNDVNSTGTDEDIITGTIKPGPARYPQSTWASYAAYLTYRYSLTENLALQAGARYNQFVLDAEFDTTFYPFPYTTAKIDNGALTGSLGFVYSPTEQFSISANASTAFRAPNVDDVGKVFDSEPGSVVVPNPELNAEYAYHLEVGAAKAFGETVEVDVTAFYTRLTDALVRRNFILNGQDSIMYDGTLSQVQAIQNAALANVYGIQAGIDIKLPQGFGFRTRFNYQKGEEELDDGTTSPSRHAAPWFGATHLTYGISGLLDLDFYAMYSGERKFEDLPVEEQGKDFIYAIDDNGNPYSPGWFTLNFKALCHLNDHFAISAGVENLTDLRYRPYSSGLVASGRNVILSLQAKF